MRKRIYGKPLIRATPTWDLYYEKQKYKKVSMRLFLTKELYELQSRWMHQPGDQSLPIDLNRTGHRLQSGSCGNGLRTFKLSKPLRTGAVQDHHEVRQICLRVCLLFEPCMMGRHVMELGISGDSGSAVPHRRMFSHLTLACL